MTKKLLKTFKSVLLEASELFSVPPYKVTSAQFYHVLGGRIPYRQIMLFGFGPLKNYVAPAPGGSPVNAEFKKLLAKLAQKAA